VCQALAALPSVPTGGPSVSLPTGVLTSLLGNGVLRDGSHLGARRASYGPRGPTMRQLTRLYDPALVDLLVPGMVMTR
jgi:phospholipid/cholesterol/gamma-HCH transport system substrate-binding protein